MVRMRRVSNDPAVVCKITGRPVFRRQVAFRAVLFVNRTDLLYALVILWAFLGILLKRLAVDAQPSRAILITLAAAMAVVTVFLLLRIPRWLRT